MSVKVWGFIGVNGSGKGHRAEQKECETGGTIFDFSDGVRDYTFSFLGWEPLDQDDYETFKLSRFSIGGLGNNIICNGRDFLDNVGKKMRDFDKNFWANYAKNAALASGEENVIFSSCRYDNELDAVVSFCHQKNANFENVKFIFCDYHSDKYDDTPKEYQELALMFRDEYGCKDGQDITDLVLEFLSAKTKING